MKPEKPASGEEPKLIQGETLSGLGKGGESANATR